MTEWGPLQPILALLSPEEGVNDGSVDRKQADIALAAALGGDALSAAVRAASIDQLDVALSHEALAVERLPLSFLLLLYVCVRMWHIYTRILTVVRCCLCGRCAKAGKLEPVRHQAELGETRAALLLQVSQLLLQVPVAVAAKEIKRLSILCSQYARLAVDMQLSIRTLLPLKNFLRRYREQGHAVLTPLHGNFFYLCLHAKCYFAAVDILDEYERGRWRWEGTL
jgi:hypothetical protein